MTSQGLGEMFEGDSADTFAHVDGGPSGWSIVNLELFSYNNQRTKINDEEAYKYV